MEVNGCKNMKHVLNLFGQDGFQIPLSILIDEDAVPDISKLFNIERSKFKQNSISVSVKDLEDEYAQALDHNVLVPALVSSDLFDGQKRKELDDKFKKGEITDADIAEFCRCNPKRHPNHKIAAAAVVSDILDKNAASSIKSIMDLLDDIENARND